MKNKSVFKSQEGREKVLSYYNQVLNFFPFEKRYVSTSFGKTFILQSGNKDMPPVILLHGSCSNSAFWFSEISALSENYNVFAIDIIGEAGNSEEVRLDINSDDYPVWLKEVFDNLFIQKAVVIGNSLGGWLALKFAVTFPDYVNKLVLIAASGITPVLDSFMLQSLKFANGSDKDELNAMQDSVIGNDTVPKEVADFISLILENFIPITEALPVFSDEQILKLNMPVLYIAGEEDVTVDTKKTAQRLRSLIPRSEIHLIINCGHAVMNSAEFIKPFLNMI